MEFRIGNIDKFNKNLNNIIKIISVCCRKFIWMDWRSFIVCFFYFNVNFILKFFKLVMKYKIVIVDIIMC